MKSKLALIWIYALFFGNVFANEIGQTLYVRAKAGLNIREAPSVSGKKIKTLSFDSKVTVLEVTAETVRINDLPGRWLKVSDGKDKGWAFSAYMETYNEASWQEQKKALDEQSREMKEAQGEAEKSYKQCIKRKGSAAACKDLDPSNF